MGKSGRWVKIGEPDEGGFGHMRYPAPTGQLQLLASDSTQSEELLLFSPNDPLSRLSFPNSDSDNCLS
jgi:hypothetical protein